jgi:2-keto-4-pentenoate hydratase/2-oxohepta-3-ene-1,7-dioic acid hydratase in catechol pathway
MKTCRLIWNNETRNGVVENLAGHDTVIGICSRLLPSRLSELETEQRVSVPLAEAKLLTPVQPSKIVCVGRNYREHAAELGNEVPPEPLIFLKPPSSLLKPSGTIVRPRISNRVDFEGELGVIIGTRCSKLQPGEDVRPYVLGYTCVNDVTARDLQKKDGQWTRGKGFDTFCPVGPVISDEVDPWGIVQVQTRVNGDLKQDGNTRDFIFPVDTIIRYISQIMTLLPGDLIATGTPAGVGPLQPGDAVEVSVSGIGTLRNIVADEWN